MRFVKELTRPCGRQGTCAPGFVQLPGVAPVMQAEPWLHRCYDAEGMVFSFTTRRHTPLCGQSLRTACNSGGSGYNLARMKFEILFTPEAISDIKALRAHDRAVVKDVIAERLGLHPTTTSRSGIKRLRSLSKPQYRLRVNDIRVFYDVCGNEVVILAIVPKPEIDAWLAVHGEQEDEENRAV